MKKDIRLLIESFFDDDIFNVNDDINQDILDIGDQYYDYHIGDIYYKDKKPYAICCGDNSYFYDNNPRFCILDISNLAFLSIWSLDNKLLGKLHKEKPLIRYQDSLTSKVLNPILKKYPSKNNIKKIDEDGYKNTQIIKNNCETKLYPAFYKCLQYCNNIYLPAIDELLALLNNIELLHKKLIELKHIDLLNYFKYYPLISSTQINYQYVYCINLNYKYLDTRKKTNACSVLPYYKI